MRNVHVRALPVPASRVGPLIDQLSGPDDPLWPTPAWPPIRFDRPLSVGADGGHGPIRYHVTAYEPGRHVRFAFHPETGLHDHELAVAPAGEHACVLRHAGEGRVHGRMVALWPLVVRWLHDALIEDLLDNAELTVTGSVARPAHWSPWVRLLRARRSVRPREVPVPAAAVLAWSAFEKIDFRDAWQLPLPASVTSDPAAWAEAAFRSPPRWLAALYALRNALVGLIGIERGDRSAFDPVALTENELLLGTDAGHLDFRKIVQPCSPSRRAHTRHPLAALPTRRAAQLRHSGKTRLPVSGLGARTPKVHADRGGARHAGPQARAGEGPPRAADRRAEPAHT